jgi:quinoprotein glucose dehydrogenase
LAGLAVRFLGVLVALIGAVIAVLGGQLLLLGGSAYYLPTGVAMVASGLLLLRLRLAGVWVYAAVYAATVVWALWEVGLQGWPLLPRLAGPSILMPFVLLTVPALRPSRPARKAAWVMAGAFLLVIVGGGALVALANRSPLAAPLPEPASAAAAGVAGEDWPTYGGDPGARRFSSLSQIDAGNAGRLQRAWLAHTGDLPTPNSTARYAGEVTPLKAGGVLYLCSAKNILIALDAATGKERWRHDPGIGDEWIPNAAACRGVVRYVVPGAPADQPCAERIVEGTLDARLIAVDARTGRLCPGFGAGGQVDTKPGMGSPAPGRQAITSPPTLVRNVLVVGRHVPDDGRDLAAPSGAIQGYDAVTGALLWTWDMARPAPAAAPPATPPAAGAPAPPAYTPGTPNMWTMASGDDALGLVYLPLANSAVDHWSSSRRPEENRYSSALVALDVTTGRPAWSFQTVHKDVWDYDLGAQASLIDFPTAAGPVPALLLPSKQGEIFVLDRRNGRPLVGVQERPAPQGGAEPLARAKTQPVSLYHTIRPPPLRERDMWGFSPLDQLLCRLQFRKADYRGPYTPPTAQRPYIQYPGSNGGVDWGGLALDPRRGVIVANYNDMPNYSRLVPREVPKPAPGAAPGAVSPYGISVNPGWALRHTGLPCKQPPYGGIRAIDLKTGKTLWDRPLGSARRDGPFHIASRLPIDIGAPNNGGALVTAGGLIFIAATTDDIIRAIDLKTGETVWSDTLPAGGQATPMTYMAGGRQYLVIMAGGHHLMGTPIGDTLVAYALP